LGKYQGFNRNNNWTDICMNKRLFSSLAAMIVGFLGLCQLAHATTEINPPRVTLTADSPVAVLTITNDRDVPAGYDIEAFGWEQEADGKVLLPPTNAIRVEPTSLDIPAHGSAPLKVTAVVPPPKPGSAESVYRIRIAERADRAREENESDIQMIAAFTLPVFQKPLETTHIGRLTSSPVANGALTFTVHNSRHGTYLRRWRPPTLRLLPVLTRLIGWGCGLTLSSKLPPLQLGLLRP